LSIRPWTRKLELQSFSKSSEDQMNIHKNAYLAPLDRERVVRQVLSGQSRRTSGRCIPVRKRVKRFMAEGVEGPLLPSGCIACFV
jgi:hypothetical protein